VAEQHGDAMKKKFTEEGVARLNPPPNGRVEYGDAYMSGLMLRVTSCNGSDLT